MGELGKDVVSILHRHPIIMQRHPTCHLKNKRVRDLINGD
jgi:hypothetical protein